MARNVVATSRDAQQFVVQGGIYSSTLRRQLVRLTLTLTRHYAPWAGGRREKRRGGGLPGAQNMNSSGFPFARSPNSMICIIVSTAVHAVVQ
jgi:hypothetical protein